MMRIPLNSATDSNLNRPPVPTEIGHPAGVGDFRVLGLVVGSVIPPPSAGIPLALRMDSPCRRRRESITFRRSARNSNRRPQLWGLCCCISPRWRTPAWWTKEPISVELPCSLLDGSECDRVSSAKRLGYTAQCANLSHRGIGQGGPSLYSVFSRRCRSLGLGHPSPLPSPEAGSLAST